MEDKDFVKICEKSETMAKAALALGLKFTTFKRKALKLGCYKPNQSGKGITKKHNGNKIPLNEILEGKHPTYQTLKLKKRLIKEGIKDNKCEECGVSKWNGKDLECHLDHINGDSKDHRIENLKILCPNCHSQTDTYCGRNIKK
jgi:5-methylcytosine-specific restriction endonuclease McrA